MFKSSIILLKKSEEQSIINSISEIEKICFSDPWTEASIKQELLNKNALWACSFCDEVLIGFGLIWIVAGECQLLRLAVRPEFRRLGVGNKILNTLIESARNDNCDSMFLEVRISNLSAVNLYESLDFKQIGVRKGYYLPEKEDALLYMKKLTR